MIVQGTAHLRPTALLRRMTAIQEVSEGSRRAVVATLTVLGRQVTIYRDGSRDVSGVELDEQEASQSELLRFTHASYLLRQPVGDKRILYVDSTTDPVTVFIDGKDLTQ